MYVEDNSVTPSSARLIWTIGAETAHGDAILSYDVEAETHYHPGVWKTLATGKPLNFQNLCPYTRGLKFQKYYLNIC